MTDPFATPDPQAPQEPTPVYDSANPAGSAPQAPQPNEPAPVLYGESVTFTETSTPAPNPSPAYGAPADPSAATFSAPAYSAPVDPNAAAFNTPAYGGAPCGSRSKRGGVQCTCAGRSGVYRARLPCAGARRPDRRDLRHPDI